MARPPGTSTWQPTADQSPKAGGSSGAEAFGPYGTQEIANAALESALIDGVVEDTDSKYVLEDVYVIDGPRSIARIVADYTAPLGVGVTLIDPHDPSHYGGIR